MFGTCLRKELLLNLKSARFLLTLLLFCLAAMTTTAIRTSVYTTQQLDHQQAATIWNGAQALADHNPYESGWLGTMAEKEPNPLAIFVGGLENDMSPSFSMMFNRYAGVLGTRFGMRRLTGVTFRRFITLDFALLVALVGSVLALLLVFDSVCGERQQGTLALQLAGPLPRDTVLFAKVAAGMVTLAVPLLALWVGALAWVMLPGKIALTADQLLRLGAIAGVSLLFVLCFFAFGVLVSCVSRTSSAALGIALLAWVAMALVVPNTVPVVARHFAPIPPASKVELEKDAAVRAIWRDDYPGWAREVMAQTGVKGWNEVWSAGLAQRIQDKQAKTGAAIDRVYLAQVKDQTRLTQTLSRVSPVASFLSCATQIAGVGIEDYHNLVSAIDRFFEQSTSERVNMDRKADELSRQQNYPHGYDPAWWPAFRLDPIPLGRALADCRADLALLAGAGALCLMAAYLLFLRGEVR